MRESALSIVAVYAALNALLILGLAYQVGHHRGRTGALEPGEPGDAVLTRAVRAHGNATEYIPTALVLCVLLALLSAPVWLLHALGAAFTSGRVLQALGMMREKHPNPVRFAGNLLTGIVYLTGSCATLYFALR